MSGEYRHAQNAVNGTHTTWKIEGEMIAEDASGDSPCPYRHSSHSAAVCRSESSSSDTGHTSISVLALYTRLLVATCFG